MLLYDKKIRASLQQQHYENVEADTPSAYWKRAVYFPFLDHLLSEVNAGAVSETLIGLISSTTSNTRQLLVLVIIPLHFNFIFVLHLS